MVLRAKGGKKHGQPGKTSVSEVIPALVFMFLSSLWRVMIPFRANRKLEKTWISCLSQLIASPWNYFPMDSSSDLKATRRKPSPRCDPLPHPAAPSQNSYVPSNEFGSQIVAPAAIQQPPGYCSNESWAHYRPRTPSSDTHCWTREGKKGLFLIPQMAESSVVSGKKQRERSLSSRIKGSDRVYDMILTWN